jgi:hypothetical protein
MQIEASVLKDYLESLGKMVFCNISDRCYEWIDEFVPGMETRSDTLYVCDGRGFHDRPCVSCISDCSENTVSRATSQCVDAAGRPDVLLIVDDDGFGPSCASSCEVVFACRTRKSSAELSKLLQNYLRKLSNWKLEMDNAMLSGGMYQTILALSEPILENTIVITDYDYNLVAYTEGIPIDDVITNRLIDLGCHDHGALRAFKNAHLIDDDYVPTGGKRTRKARPGIGKYEFMDHTYAIDGAFFAHLVMQCNNRKPTRGLERLFSILVESVGHCVAKDWSLKEGSGSRGERLVLSLLNATALRSAELVDLCERYEVPRYGRFRVHLFDIGHECPVGQAIPRISKALGQCWSVMRNDRIIVLCANGDMAGRRQIMEHAELSHYLEVHDIRDGVSNLHGDIIETGAAFREAEIALKYAPFAAQCNLDVCDGGADISFFDACAMFWVLDNGQKEDPALAKFLLEHNPVKRMLDCEKGGNATEDARILYYYLHFDCNAAAVAQSLCMHRNSICYRVKKICENSNLDLEDPVSRDYLRLLLSWMLLEGSLEL